MDKKKKKKCGKIKLRHLGIILGAVIYYCWQRDKSLSNEADENEAELGGFDDFY